MIVNDPSDPSWFVIHEDSVIKLSSFTELSEISSKISEALQRRDRKYFISRKSLKSEKVNALRGKPVAEFLVTISYKLIWENWNIVEFLEQIPVALIVIKCKIQNEWIPHYFDTLNIFDIFFFVWIVAK